MRLKAEIELENIQTTTEHDSQPLAVNFSNVVPRGNDAATRIGPRATAPRAHTAPRASHARDSEGAKISLTFLSPI